jgi:glycosyltransferase involved in cell wall biosynthesis
MKISIITVVLNNVETINDAIRSVLEQTYKDIEYIVIDGDSNDGTIDAIKSYGSKIDKFVSEKDNGLYDAMNKGIGMASGDVIGILNSDDVYFDNDVIKNIINVINTYKVDSVYGDLYYVKKNNLQSILRYWKSSDFKKGAFAKGWHPPHPSFFVKRNVYTKYGLFNLNMNVAADFELMLRFLEKHEISSTYLPKVIVRMRMGGASNNNLKNILAGQQAILKSFDHNKIKVNKFMYFIYRYFPKIIQLIKRQLLEISNMRFFK